jgi:hypothetical protein
VLRSGWPGYPAANLVRARAELNCVIAGRVARVECVVPFAVKVVPDKAFRRFEVVDLSVGDLDAAWVVGGFEFGVHGQPATGGGGSDGVDDDLVAFRGGGAALS